MQGVNYVAVGEIGLDHVRARQDRCLPGFGDWRERSVSLWSFTVEAE